MTCPFCNSVFPITNDTVRIRFPSFYSSDADSHAKGNAEDISEWERTRDALSVKFSLCPSCDKHSIVVSGVGFGVKGHSLNFIPSSLAKQFPDYVPESIRNDYEESYKIVDLSPKASATLSRRCLQGMIRDYWEVTNQRTLYEDRKSVVYGKSVDEGG